jgi:Tfp pilus assembly protein PilN
MRTLRSIDLDFVAAPRAAWAGRALLLAGVVALLGACALAGLAWNSRQAERDALSQLAMVTAPAAVRAPADPAQVRAAQRVGRELQMPWGELLAAIESVPARDVAVLAIEPAAARQSLRITADARHPDAMLDYLAALKRQALTEVVLTSHQVQSQIPGNPIRFQVQAQWGRAARSAPPAPAVATPERPATTTATTAAVAAGERAP